MKRTTKSGFVAQFATVAAGERRIPKAGNPEAVRAYLRGAMGDGDMFDAADDAEADWQPDGGFAAAMRYVRSVPKPDFINGKLLIYLNCYCHDCR